VPVRQAAKLIGMADTTAQRMSRGEIEADLRFTIGLNLIRLHRKHCPNSKIDTKGVV